jgi:hypothetical protein
MKVLIPLRVYVNENKFYSIQPISVNISTTVSFSVSVNEQVSSDTSESYLFL